MAAHNFSALSIDYQRLMRNSQATGPSTAITGQGPMLINEVWTAAIDLTNVWTQGVGGTGTNGQVTTSGRNRVRSNCPAATDIARFTSAKTFWNPQSSTIGTDLYPFLVAEWEGTFGTLLNTQDATFIMGLSPNGDRSVNPSMGFIIDSNQALRTLTKGASETTTLVASAPTLTVSNLYKQVIRNGAVDFYVNGVLKNTHTANIPSGILYFWVYMNSKTGASDFHTGPIRVYYMDAN